MTDNPERSNDMSERNEGQPSANREPWETPFHGSRNEQGECAVCGWEDVSGKVLQDDDSDPIHVCNICLGSRAVCDAIYDSNPDDPTTRLMAHLSYCTSEIVFQLQELREAIEQRNR